MVGEVNWPTQPIPTAPEAFARQGFTEADVTNISAESREYVLRRLKDLPNGSIYTPPSKQGTVFSPGTLGGGLWGGAASIRKPGICTSTRTTRQSSLH